MAKLFLGLAIALMLATAVLGFLAKGKIDTLQSQYKGTKQSLVQTQNSLRNHENTLKNFRDPFQEARANISAHRGNLQSSGNGAEGGVRVEADAHDGTFRGNVQGGAQVGQHSQPQGKSAKAG